MDLAFDLTAAIAYRGGTQRARVLTEDWFARSMYCVACAEPCLRRLPNNNRASDFACPNCGTHFELKSGKARFGNVVPDGAYAAMTARLDAGTAPHLALLRYGPSSVRDLVVIPAPLLTHDLIVRRKPLPPTARRAGWVGCNIRIGGVPQVGRHVVVEDGTPRPPAAVVASWTRVAAMQGRPLATRTWMVDVLRCVERFGARDFTLAETYAFEDELSSRHPGNANVRPKIRQQLQRLRDAGWLEFVSPGRYRLRDRGI